LVWKELVPGGLPAAAAAATGSSLVRAPDIAPATFVRNKGLPEEQFSKMREKYCGPNLVRNSVADLECLSPRPIFIHNRILDFGTNNSNKREGGKN
jgi:hypothetical protein